MLGYYAGRFATVEINNTFYRLPSEAAVKGWVDQTPRGFEYAVKASRYLTHVKKLKDLAKYGKTRLFNALAPMADSGKLAVILWQLPPNFHRNDERLEQALGALEDGCRHAFEFRHPSWFDDEVYALLKDAGAALCFSEREDGSAPALVETAPWGYVRLRLETYSEADLEQWAGRLAKTGWNEVYVYFMHEPTAPAYAQTLMKFKA